MGPADDACQSCWTLWRDAFAFVTWETFCKESNTNPKFQAKVDEAKASEGATEAPIRGGNVLGKNTFHIEVREAVELVTKQELTIALNTRVLPKAHAFHTALPRSEPPRRCHRADARARVGGGLRLPRP